VLRTLTSFVYTFGFVCTHVALDALSELTPINTDVQAQLVPQLIINYKLKVKCIEES
jgi:hypothetical protein